MISTRNLTELPDLAAFAQLTQALAMLDAVMSPDWQYRYYSFNSRWSEGSMMASMRNGSGDAWFALLSPAGIALKGLAHESHMNRGDGRPWPGIFETLPVEFHDTFLREPAFAIEWTTFCVWRRSTDTQWSCGRIEFPPPDPASPSSFDSDPDGSEWLLSILDGDPRRYVEFSRRYYGRELALADVAAVYRHAPLTDALVRRLNPDVDLASLAEDIDTIGYPESPGVSSPLTRGRPVPSTPGLRDTAATAVTPTPTLSMSGTVSEKTQGTDASAPPEAELEGLEAALRSVFPIVAPSHPPAQLEFVSCAYGPPEHDVEVCRRRGLTYGAPLKVTLRLFIFEVGDEAQPMTIAHILEQDVCIGVIPLMTGNGTFVVAGTERVIDSRMRGDLDGIDRFGKLIENQYRAGLPRMEATIRERLSSIGNDPVMPQALVDPEPVMVAIMEVFSEA